MLAFISSHKVSIIVKDLKISKKRKNLKNLIQGVCECVLTDIHFTS